MPITPTYPGVYIEEVPSGVRTIVGVATSIAAFVGYTAKGPLNKAVRLYNFGDYKRIFGDFHPDSKVCYAVNQFFLNGGTDCYVVRVADGAETAKVDIQEISQNTIVLTIEAANEGIWGNDIYLDIDYNANNPDSMFNLTAYSYERKNSTLTLKTSEKFRNLSMNSLSSRHVVNVLEAQSNLIRAKLGSSLTHGTGYSLSKPLSFPLTLENDSTKNINESIISGIYDGLNSFTIDLNTPPGGTTITNMTNLVSFVDGAILSAGLNTKIEVSQANIFGGTTGTTNCLKIASWKTNTEDSAVKIIKASKDDASKALKLGLHNEGREIEGSSQMRPAPTGTMSDDLAGRIGQTLSSGNINVIIQDYSSGSAVPILTSTAITPLPTTVTTIGPDLCTIFQNELRKIDNKAAQQAKVEMNGTYMRIVPSASTPNAIITFTGTAANNNNLRLTATNPSINLQQYNLGKGVTYAAQSITSTDYVGDDGAVPTVNNIKGNHGDKTGMYALRDVDLFNILTIPRTTELTSSAANSLIADAISFCEEERAFYILDPDPQKTPTDVAAWVSGIGTSKNAAVFFPQVKIADPLDEYRLKFFPPSGTIAGIFARTDTERGVWKAPAGLDATMKGVQSLKYILTDPENGSLNPLRVNCLRSFPVYGTVVWGTRTLAGADTLASEWKYISIRRLALFIEESLFRGTKWVVFEPNDEPLWAKIRMNVGAFMMRLFRQGAFQGSTPDKAFYVKCDSETTTETDRNLGIVNIEVGFAPLKPAEFVIIKIQQIASEQE